MPPEDDDFDDIVPQLDAWADGFTLGVGPDLDDLARAAAREIEVLRGALRWCLARLPLCHVARIREAIARQGVARIPGEVLEPRRSPRMEDRHWRSDPP